MNAKCPQISDEKKSFALLTKNFGYFKIRIKSYLSKWQTFFHQKFCIYFLQALKSEYEGIYLLQALSIRMRVFTFCRLRPSDSEGNNSIFFRRSFFLLGFEGISYNSVGLIKLDLYYPTGFL